jgi:hypothetical protein
MVKDCPKCGLVNPPEALRCDCGYDFATRQMQGSYLDSKSRSSADSPTTIEILVCIFLPFFGLIFGLVARSQGRRGAGNKMLLLSVAFFVMWTGVRVLVGLASQ